MRKVKDEDDDDDGGMANGKRDQGSGKIYR